MNLHAIQERAKTTRRVYAYTPHRGCKSVLVINETFWRPTGWSRRAAGSMIRLVFHRDEKPPVLHIHSDDPEGICELQDLFERLSRDPQFEVDLAAISGVECEGVSAVRLSHVEGRSDFDPAVRVETNGGEIVIRWARGASGWSWCAELAESLCGAPPGRFQYLTQSASDDAEIELDFLAHL